MDNSEHSKCSRYPKNDDKSKSKTLLNIDLSENNLIRSEYMNYNTKDIDITIEHLKQDLRKRSY